MNIKGVLFDFIGTTVIEKEPLAIHRCFRNAFADHDVIVTDEMIRSGRGKDKRDMIRHTLTLVGRPLDLAEPVLHSLQTHLAGSLDNFRENRGAADLFRFMKVNKIKLGIGSGLPRQTFEKITTRLNWHLRQFDYIGIAEEMKKGRPAPDMIFDMMDKCQLQPGELIKVGDTIADIQEGKNANAITVAILSGTQSLSELSSQHPDYLIHSLDELKQIINRLNEN